MNNVPLKNCHKLTLVFLKMKNGGTLSHCYHFDDTFTNHIVLEQNSVGSPSLCY